MRAEVEIPIAKLTVMRELVTSQLMSADEKASALALLAACEGKARGDRVIVSVNGSEPFVAVLT